MSDNNRVFYPLNYVAIGEHGAATGSPIYGVQSVDMDTNFDLEQVFELGQLDIYENIENLPSVEMTIEKVLDGEPLVYHRATSSATSSSLNARSTNRADVFLSLFSDTKDNSTGDPLAQAYCSGMYIESLTYNLPVDGNATESVTLVGNDKIWIGASGDSWAGGTGFAFTGHFSGGDTPASGVQRRQDVVMGPIANGGSVWPTNIPGMSVTNGSGYNADQGERYDVHIQDVSVSTNLNRNDLFELGRRVPYFRYAQFPTAVDCTINIISAGSDPSDGVEAKSGQDNLSDEPIVIKLADSTSLDLGTKNRLQSVTFTGGDTDGNNATIEYNYQNFNNLTVTQNQDPASL